VSELYESLGRAMVNPCLEPCRRVVIIQAAHRYKNSITQQNEFRQSLQYHLLILKALFVQIFAVETCEKVCVKGSKLKMTIEYMKRVKYFFQSNYSKTLSVPQSSDKAAHDRYPRRSF
jgi:hypothetical protein